MLRKGGQPPEGVFFLDGSTANNCLKRSRNLTGGCCCVGKRWSGGGGGAVEVAPCSPPPPAPPSAGEEDSPIKVATAMEVTPV